VNHRPLYEQLGVTPIINAAGTFTHLGGSLMSPEVIAAWSEAARQFVDLEELQDRVGERLAELLEVEAALVTGGAASGILLATAAALTLRDADFVHRQPTAQRPYEVLRQKSHRDPYDRQLETCGVRIVEVESAADVHRLVNERTVMMAAYHVHELDGQLSHAQWLDLAREYSLVTLLDAAADVPPVDNLSRFNKLGYDLVVFSGGKAIGGPQDTGLLLGRRDLIAAAKKNASPNEGTIGRAAKVSKEDMVAIWKAVEIFAREGDQIGERCRRRLTRIEEALQEVPTLTTRLVTPPVANHFPHLMIEWDESSTGVSYAEMKARLWQGTPRIATERVHGTGTDGFLISAINLQPGEEVIVGQRIAAILRGA
jgi:L-seryl-tRNA(Ser) seleniumtransferase